jgi:hypothetical protein
MRKYYIKIITGFRVNQEITIPMQEAHKAYYLFYNPTARGTFSNGVALIGSDVRQIIPDFNETMGWNQDHKPDSYDQRELNDTGVKERMYELMETASSVSKIVDSNKKMLSEKFG